MHTLHGFTPELSRIDCLLLEEMKRGREHSHSMQPEMRKWFSELGRIQALRLLCCGQPSCHPCPVHSGMKILPHKIQYIFRECFASHQALGLFSSLLTNCSRQSSPRCLGG